MMTIKAMIPNMITSMNLFCGCIAVLSFLSGYYELGIVLIIAASVLDFFDGLVARLLKVQGELGKQLDSLADMVSFGFVPGTIMFVALLKSQELSGFSEVINTSNYLPLFGFVITIFSGLRLAIFNIATNQTTEFIGLPTPANTLFFLTLPAIWVYYTDWEALNVIVSNTTLLLSLTVIFSILMVSKIRMISLKFKNLEFKSNQIKYYFLIGCAAFIYFFGILSIPFIMIYYVILSIISNATQKK